ncbi:putative malate:quinone oxidoreductase [Gregarina niphandrodes]|uniref:Malate:quinone oxidoreductase n=1 Tax=Gregarina niphandrodes TaxID=110365 RepID=A0A023B0N0_GRENI|nr:putative malate:quinone oxidoreductase [Gregarina niphandrodes]EZG45503.1 putative malate:quinone oxidoreductase [Gregarina niphandrodes]|eukprot:XP_011132479.1 putative malate:quinone oxidoreductase [Gregarina niphandrodes]
MELLDKKRLGEVEPAVAFEDAELRKFRKESVVANYIGDEHSAVDYFQVTNNFVKRGENLGAQTGRVCKAMAGTEMLEMRREGKGWIVETNRGRVRARFVVVSSCGYSLLTAHRLGYGHHLSCLPVAGSFYFGPKVLRGKVYCVQNPLLPFAAVHGDPDLVAGGKTRFGPTALPLPLLERYQWHTFPDFLKTLRVSPGLLQVYWGMFKNSTMRNYLFKNLLFEIPHLNTRLFLKSINKIVPSLTVDQLSYAQGFGGVRPQVIDKNQKKLLLGEGKIDPEDAPIIFNITPSPGGTTCLGTAETDVKKITKWLGCNYNQTKFKHLLLDGLYPEEK